MVREVVVAVSMILGRCSVKVADIREALNQCIRATEVSLAVWSGTRTQGANHSSMRTTENDTITEHLQCVEH